MQRDSSSDAAVERLRFALELFDDAVDMLRLRLRRDRPGATSEEIEVAVEAWIAHRPGAEQGDFASDTDA